MRRYRHPQVKEGECSLPKSAGNQKLDEPQQQKPEPKTKKTTPAQQPSSQLISMQTNKNTNSGQLDTKQLVGQENSSCNPLDLSCFTKQEQQQQDPEVRSSCTENVATTAETSALQSSNNLEENAARADELKIFKF